MYNPENKSIQRLFQAITNISSVEECQAFLEDICTIKEMLDMSQRLDTAIMLNQKKSYQQISESVGVSTATISRVNRCLSYGPGGYITAINKLGETENTK